MHLDPTPARPRRLPILLAALTLLWALPWLAAGPLGVQLRGPGAGAGLGYVAAYWVLARSGWLLVGAGYCAGLLALALVSRELHLWLYRARVFTQWASILLFFALVWQTQVPADAGALAEGRSAQIAFQGQAYLDADPLIGLATSLSSHALPAELLWGIPLVVLTLLLGRVFCGWICPFGILHNAVGWLRMKMRLTAGTDHGAPSGWQRFKYGVLVVILVASLFSVQPVGIMDPIALVTRSAAIAVLPMLQYTLGAVFEALPEVSLAWAPGADADLTVLAWLRAQRVVQEPAHYHSAILIGTLFVGLLALNFVRLRFWCRYLCPLGALLGLLARFSLQTIVIKKKTCTSCNLCNAICEGAADPEQRHGAWNRMECFYCYSCVDECPPNALAVSVSLPGRRARGVSGAVRPSTEPALSLPKGSGRTEPPPAPVPAVTSTSLGRRAFLGSVALGAVLVPLLRAPFNPKRAHHPLLIRPPGSQPEPEFLAKCIRCAECMKVCPTNALHPAGLAESGLEGLWTPVFKMRQGYCQYGCTLCGQVCPTDAIELLELAVKQRVKVGVAHVNLGRCLPYSYGTECIVCEEFCPTSPKAIRAQPRYAANDDREIERIRADVQVIAGRPEVRYEVETVRAGEQHLVYPVVDHGVCIGCGVCEFVCPVRDEAAIYVHSVNESRAAPDGNVLGI